jgi:hypothetical protein
MVKDYRSIYESDPTGDLNCQFVVSGSLVNWLQFGPEPHKLPNFCICFIANFQRLN